MVGKSDFNENPVVSLDLDLDLGFVKNKYPMSQNMMISLTLMTIIPVEKVTGWDSRTELSACCRVVSISMTLWAGITELLQLSIKIKIQIMQFTLL